MSELLLVRLLGCALNEKAYSGEIAEPQWEKILVLARRHKVANTLACGLPLMERKPGPEVSRQLEGLLMQEMAVGSEQLYAASELQKAFEEQGLYNMTLKGIHTKLRYPQDYMRSMGDLDVLCKPEQQARVRSAMEALGYTDYQEGRKHDHYTRLPYVTVEMHRQLVAASSPYSRYYADIWQRCEPLPGCRYSYAMSLEDEYLYNLLHLVEHMKEGGVGIRFIMDVYVYERQSLDREYLSKELDKLELTAFYENIRALARYWFDPEPPRPSNLTLELAEFVLSGGVYGSTKNAQALAVTKGGRVGFFLRTCFPGYREMCSMFPWLEKWPVLLPVSWVIRAIRSLLFRRKTVQKQMQTLSAADGERGARLRQFYARCGLPE